MARLPYASAAQLQDMMSRSGLPENTPRTNAFRMLAHRPALSASALGLVLALLTETDLDPKLRELVILRVSQRCGGRYAWVQHATIAALVGVESVQIAALERSDTPASLFADRECTAFAFADEVLDTCCAKDDMFTRVHETFSAGEILELLLLIGYFRMICGVMTTLHVELEPAFGAEILDPRNRLSPDRRRNLVTSLIEFVVRLPITDAREDSRPEGPVTPAQLGSTYTRRARWIC